MSSRPLVRALALLVAALSAPLAPADTAPAPASASDARGLARANLDPGVDACDDFYAYANGGWLARNPVPPAYASWGTFNELEKRNNERLQAIAAAAAANEDARGVEALIGAFYAAAMDEARIESLGLEPIAADLAAIDALDTPADVARHLIAMHAAGTGVLFGLSVRPDLKDDGRMLVYASQGGLGLPNRDFYLREDEASKRQLEQYREHVAATLALAGATRDAAAADAAAIVALETRFARSFLPREEMRDPNRSYHLVSVAAADAATPNFAWSALFETLGLDQMREFSLSHPQFFAAMDAALADTPVATWRAWLRWNVLRAASPLLARAYADENFRFYQQLLRGQQVQRPRAERTIEQMNALLGEPLGQLFVARYFPPAAKARMLVMIGDLKAALRERLEGLEWMSDETRRQALAKWSTFTAKIGYPERWRDYSGVTLSRTDHVGNVRALLRHAQAEDFAKIGKPVDRSEWGMPPQQVNAYYNPTWNEIVFPAGILQPPFFDLEADDALNYGAIGAVIGHELLHGFDDSGSRFDARGRLRMWWTEADRKAFDARAQRLVDQAGEFVAIGDLRLNGRISLGENIADLGGLQIAYLALKQRLAASPQPDSDGFTPAQRFFLGWAQVWRRNWTDAALRLQVNTGPHAPGKFRVNGPLANLSEFHAAFGCEPGDPMVRPEASRVAIW